MTDQLTQTAAEIGTIRRFNADPYAVMDEVREQLPEGITVGYTQASTIPEGTVSIGTVTVRQSDPALTLYLFRRGPGRPEVGRMVNVRMPDALISAVDGVRSVNAEHDEEWAEMPRAEVIRRLLIRALYGDSAGTDPAQLWRERRGLIG